MANRKEAVAFPRSGLSPKHDPKANEEAAARSVGAVVSLYRRARGMTQQELQEGGEGVVSASALAMIEGGDRLPTEKALRFLCERLRLSPFQTEQLRQLAHDPERTDEERLQSIMPSDVLRGVALFIRPTGDDSALLKSAEVEEVWVVTKKPLTVKAGHYEQLRDRLVKQNIRFTYFIDPGGGKGQFLELYGKLQGDPALDSAAKKRLSSRLRCVVVPSTLTIFGFVLFNPNIVGRMFGRSVVMDDYGLTIGVIPMDRPKVTASFELLHTIVEKLEELGSGKTGAIYIEGIGNCELVKA